VNSKPALSPLAATPARSPLPVVTVLLLLGALLSLHALDARLPPALWLHAAFAPATSDMRQLLFHYSDLPRIAMVWICGAALGLAGVATQQVVRNPLAEPMTLGVFPGAYLALMLAVLFYPAMLDGGRDMVALAGAGIALGLVFLLASRLGLSPLALILGGMIVNLCCGAVGMALTLAYYNKLSIVQLWCGGVLDQHDWRAVTALLPRLAPCAALLALCLRPMTVMGAGDTVASSLGVSLRKTRFSALVLTLLVTAFVTSSVGVIGFIGLGAPTLARLAGARRLGQRMLWGPLFGAALLWFADGIAQWLTSLHGSIVPTGAITSLLGAPLLLVLLPRLRGRPDIGQAAQLRVAGPDGRRTGTVALAALAFLALAATLSLGVGRGLDGWHLDGIDAAQRVLFLRGPHFVAAASVGVLLALAGTLVQMMTGNPMASPDLLGITAGGTLGLVATVFLVDNPGVPALFFACATGAALTLIVLVVLGRASSYAPETLLLTGVTLSALMQAVATIAIASGDRRVTLLLSLLVGSTYNVSATAATVVAIVALCALAVVPWSRRWLAILPLGAPIARAIGVDVPLARCALLVLSAILTAVATLIVGPLSFIGLIAPHMTRLAGVHRPLPLLFLSAALGAALMAMSDWAGRWVVFPHEIPAGIIASLAGGVYLVVMLLLRGTRN